jgi:predicted MPP superfamily phosphohydrolase
MTIIRFALFIGTFICLIFCAHYLLYVSTLRFLGIVDPTTRKVILWVLFFLALSFFPSAFLLRLHVNVVTNLYYLISCIWLGMFLYLLMALTGGWLLFGLGKLVGFIPNMRIVFLCLLIAAAGVSLYGLVRARHPVFHRVEVAIDGLPDHWRNRVIVQLSDVHLGSINKTGFLERLVGKVNSLNPDLILITGDLFDGMGGDLASFIEPLKKMKARMGIFFITGNHEGYLGLKRPLSVIRETNIRILNNEVAEIDGLQIVGVSFPEHHQKSTARDLVTASGSYVAHKPSILLYHTPTSIEEHHADRGSQQANTYWFPNTSMTLAKEVGIDLQLSGHTHKGQLFPFVWLTRAIYKGYDYGLHKDGSFHLYVSSGVGTWGPPMRIGAPPEIVVIQLR